MIVSLFLASFTFNPQDLLGLGLSYLSIIRDAFFPPKSQGVNGLKANERQLHVDHVG